MFQLTASWAVAAETDSEDVGIVRDFQPSLAQHIVWPSVCLERKICSSVIPLPRGECSRQFCFFPYFFVYFSFDLVWNQQRRCVLWPPILGACWILLCRAVYVYTEIMNCCYKQTCAVCMGLDRFIFVWPYLFTSLQ